MGRTSILLIYTGGTIGMEQDAKSGILKPFNFVNLSKQMPEIDRFDLDISSVSLKNPIDSSNMQPAIWVEIAELIEVNYDQYDGFVVLHGSDTMAYTASALSFMLENLGKPVIFTGSQLPIGIIRTDGKENLITAIEIASAKKKNKPMVPEVAIYFEYYLYRGNRTVKFNSAHFEAFLSPNYPVLAEAGVSIKYYENFIAKASGKKLSVHKELSNDIGVLKLFPGINKEITSSIFNTTGIKAVIIETYGSGNASTEKWFLDIIKKAIKQGIIVLNITQCLKGSVIQGRYETSVELEKSGVISGHDMTFEAGITKLMFLLGSGKSTATIKKMLEKNLRGELVEE